MNNKIAYFLIVILMALASGCARNATLVNFETGEQLEAVFTDSNATGGEMTVTMPDGEILKGRYTGIREGENLTFSTATASAYNANSSATGGSFGQAYSTGGKGRAYGLLTSTKPGSTLVMEIVAVYNVLDGHGHGEARTNDGRHYKLQF